MAPLGKPIKIKLEGDLKRACCMALVCFELVLAPVLFELVHWFMHSVDQGEKPYKKLTETHKTVNSRIKTTVEQRRSAKRQLKNTFPMLTCMRHAAVKTENGGMFL